MNAYWHQFQPFILELESEGLITRTFRRLDPDRQENILNAILAEAVERGPASINIKNVAARAGVAVGALYTYFPNRDGMLDFAIELAVRTVTAEFTNYQPMLAQMPLRDGLSAYLQGGLEMGEVVAGLTQFLARAAYHGDEQLRQRVVEPMANALLAMVRGMVLAAAQRGELRPGLDLEAVTRTIHALLIAVGDSQLLPYLNTYFKISDSQVSFEQSMNAALDLILHGVQANQLSKEVSS